MRLWNIAVLFGFAIVRSVAQSPAPAQNASPAQAPSQTPALQQRADTRPVPGAYTVPPGTRILLSMINSVSTKQAQIGDRIYLETAFPVLAGNKIVIPQGSWVTGTVTEVKRPG